MDAPTLSVSYSACVNPRHYHEMKDLTASNLAPLHYHLTSTEYLTMPSHSVLRFMVA
jgi:hypothetical protein